MQVRSLPRHVIRNARAASRLIDAQPPNSEAAIRRATVRELRADYPMWGKAKLTVLLRRQGYAVSESTVGRILKRLMTRGEITPVPSLRRKAPRAARRIRPHARRLPKGRKASTPGEIVQRDVLSVCLGHGRPPSSNSPPATRSPSGPAPKPVAAPPQTTPKTSSTNSSPTYPSPSKPSRSTAAAGSRPTSRPNAATATSTSSNCRPDRPSSTVTSSATTALGQASSGGRRPGALRRDLDMDGGALLSAGAPRLLTRRQARQTADRLRAAVRRRGLPGGSRGVRGRHRRSRHLGRADRHAAQALRTHPHGFGGRSRPAHQRAHPRGHGAGRSRLDQRPAGAGDPRAGVKRRMRRKLAPALFDEDGPQAAQAARKSVVVPAKPSTYSADTCSVPSLNHPRSHSCK